MSTNLSPPSTGAAPEDSEPPPFIPVEYQRAAERWAWRTVGALQRELHPLLQSVRSETVRDLPFAGSPGKGVPESPDHASPLFRPMEYGYELTVEVTELLHFDVDTFLTMLHGMADDTGAQMVQGMLQHISDICDDNDQTVKIIDGSLYEGIIQAFETVDISFNEDGSHNMTLVMSPGMSAKLAATPPTEEQVARLDAVFERRREEWRAARCRRELP